METALSSTSKNTININILCFCLILTFTIPVLASPLGFTPKSMVKNLTTKYLRVYRGQRNNINFIRNGQEGGGILLSNLSFERYTRQTNFNNPRRLPANFETANAIAMETHNEFHPDNFDLDTYLREASMTRSSHPGIGLSQRLGRVRTLESMVHTHSSIGSGMHFEESFGFPTPYLSVSINALAASVFAAHGSTSDSLNDTSVYESIVPLESFIAGTFTLQSDGNFTTERVFHIMEGGVFNFGVSEGELLAVGGVMVGGPVSATEASQRNIGNIYSLIGLQNSGICLSENLDSRGAYAQTPHISAMTQRSVDTLASGLNFSSLPPETCKQGLINQRRYHRDLDPPPPPIII